MASFESFLKWRYPKTLKFGGTFILGNLHLCYKGRCREAKDPYNVKICIKDSLRPKRTTSMDLPIILPHEMLDYLHRSKKIVVNPEQVKQYWTRYKAFKSSSHPCCKDDLLPHSPLGLAGDDCKYTLSGSKVIIIAFNLPLHDQKRKQESTEGNIAWIDLRVHEALGNSYKIPTVVLNVFLLAPIIFGAKRHTPWSQYICVYVFLAPSWGKQLDTNRFLIAALRNEPLLFPNI